MEGTIGWLLPGLLVAAVAQALFVSHRQRTAANVALIAMAVLLAGLSLRLCWAPELLWFGPTLFTLDSFHQLQLDLRLTPAQIPLLWVVWWWLVDEPEFPCRSGGRRPLMLSCLLLVFLADDVWLWYGALAAFALLQQSLVFQYSLTETDDRLTALHGCHWLGMLLLLIGVSSLSFDFRIERMSELSEFVARGDTLSEMQIAALSLTTSLAASAVLLMSSVFPVSVLRIDRNDESGDDVLSVMIAGSIALSFAPLFAQSAITVHYRPLLFLTVLFSTVCSWRQSTAKQSLRALGVALIMLAVMGLFMPGDELSGRVTRTLGLQQLALVLVWWRLWDRGRESRRMLLVTGITGGLLIAGVCCWPLFVAVPPISENAFRVPDELQILLAAGMSFGLVQVTATEFRRKHEVPGDDATGSRPRASGWNPVVKDRLVGNVFLFAFIIVLNLVELRQRSTISGFVLAPGVLAGTVAGGLAAWFFVSRAGSTGTVPSPPGPLSRLLASQFYVITIWQGVMQTPRLGLALLLNLWELRKVRPSARTSPYKSSDGHEPGFVWELGLGAAGVLILSCLFLWLGE